MATKQDNGLWEVTAEVGREKQVHTALHRGLVIADEMNVRSGENLTVSRSLLPWHQPRITKARTH